jgi:prepilin-type processing-associated H-X9-DG protein
MGDPSETYGTNVSVLWNQVWNGTMAWQTNVYDQVEWKMGQIWRNTPSSGMPDIPDIAINRPPVGASANPMTVKLWWFARPASTHPNGFQVAFCDGSVRFVGDDIRYTIYAALMTSNGADSKIPGSASPGTTTGPPWSNTIVSDADIP